MSTDRLGPDDRSALAAELALGLLEGVELADAQELARIDPTFRAEVEGWTARFAPLLDEVEEVMPPSAVWQGILGFTGAGSAPSAANDNAGQLRRSLARWRLASGGMGALAAALALVLLARPEPAPQPAPTPITASAPMIATIAGEEGGQPIRLVANWDPARRELIVTPAMAPDIGSEQAMELWVIPADGTPRSMGVMPAEGLMKDRVEGPMETMLEAGATLAISLERPGGSPTGAPQGPVVATGKLTRA